MRIPKKLREAIIARLKNETRPLNSKQNIGGCQSCRGISTQQESQANGIRAQANEA